MRAAIIGVGGYVAPRHARSIVERGGELALTCDVADSVGFLDALAPKCLFETDPDRFFERLPELGITHVVVCTPNDRHVWHTTAALDAGCDVICEKPLGIGAEEVEELCETARAHPGQTVYPIVQLRYDQGIGELREHVRSTSGRFQCVIDYQAFRGDWYRRSWKGQNRRSGGLLVNIGVHLFDLCCYVFGDFERASHTLIERDESGAEEHATGVFQCARATIEWTLSIRGPESRRVFSVEGTDFDLSNRIQVLHAEAYDRILAGAKFDLEDASRAVRAIDEIRAHASYVSSHKG